MEELTLECFFFENKRFNFLDWKIEFLKKKLWIG